MIVHFGMEFARPSQPMQYDRQEFRGSAVSGQSAPRLGFIAGNGHIDRPARLAPSAFASARLPTGSRLVFTDGATVDVDGGTSSAPVLTLSAS
jgi:hypothetical protein